MARPVLRLLLSMFYAVAAWFHLTAPGPFVAMISAVVAEVTGRTPALSTTGGTSDARFIKDYCPVIEFGLLSQQMHKTDEHVATTDLVALTAIYRRILERYFV